MFKVVADQLKVSKGWVRCGHCTEVFDGQLHMQEDHGPDSPGPANEQAHAEQDAAAPMPEVFFAGLDAPSPQTAPAASLAIDPTRSPPPDLATSQLPDQGLLAQILLEPAVDAAPPLPGDASAHQPAGQKDIEESARSTRRNFHQNGPSRDEVRDLAFMRESRSRLFWASPVVRGTLAFAALLLLFGLGLQVALDQRDRLAALEPSAKPWLEKLCEPFRCKVSPLRQLESLVIEGSSFHKMAPQTYRLAFSLRNAGALDVASPSIDLTLTDAHDQVLARRVLSAAEMSMPAAVNAGSEWTGAQVLHVSPTLGEIAGYRILAFYP